MFECLYSADDGKPTFNGEPIFWNYHHDKYLDLDSLQIFFCYNWF